MNQTANLINPTFKVTGYTKLVELDNYEKGCLPETAREFTDRLLLTAETLPELLQELLNFTNAEKDAVLLNSCEDLGRVDIQTMETARGKKASERDFERFELGEIDLYACTYTFSVKVSFDVDFTEKFALENGYSTEYTNETKRS